MRTLPPLLAMGAVVLYAAFTLLAGVAPAVVVTGIVAVLALLLFVRSLRLDYELRSRAGDPQLRSERNAQRERRGF